MTLQRLPLFNGSPVRITLNGAPAMAILFMLGVDTVQITTLCYLEKAPGPCPRVTHELTAAEIATLSPVGRSELASEIAITSQVLPGPGEESHHSSQPGSIRPHEPIARPVPKMQKHHRLMASRTAGPCKTPAVLQASGPTRRLTTVGGKATRSSVC